MMYFVYENWIAHGHHARVHKATCRHCNNGRGQAHHTDASDDNGQWHGPFATMAEARVVPLRHADATWTFCKVCRPDKERQSWS